MKKLEVAERGYHVIDIAMEKGIVKTYKIPSELTVSEVERLLELQSKIEKLHTEQVVNDGTAQLRMYWAHIYAQLEIIFRHFQPEIDADYLKLNLLPNDAIRILAFFADNRYVEKVTNVDEVPKKNLASVPA